MTTVTPERITSISASSKTDVVLIAHGSPDPRHARSIQGAARRMAIALGRTVTAAFLEHDHPRAEQVLRAGIADTAVVIPLLLTAGFHWHNDIPPLLAQNGSRIALVPPPEPVLFADAVREVAGAGTHLVLAGAGSSRPEVVTRFSRLADRLLEQPAIASATVALSPRDVPDVVRPHSTVVPVLTADGVIADRIRAAAATSGARTTRVLGDTRGFADCLSRLVGELTM